MIDYKNYFKDKKITIMGIGLLGGALNDIKFLAEQGAIITATDIKNTSQLKSSIDKLKKYKNIKYVLGEHRIEDFKNADMILQPGNVPMGSPYLKEAKKNHIPIFVSESLFAKYATGVIIIGVTGTRGKSMTTQLIYEILSQNIKNKKVYLGGNVRNTSTLALLSKVKSGDIVVMELDSWALHGMGDIKISPHISVFTTFMPDHMNYYKDDMKKYFNDKANIFKYQSKDDLLIIRPDMKKFINKSDTKSRLVVVNPKNFMNWKFNVPGNHHIENMSCAVEVAKEFKIPISKIQKSVASFKDLEGRMQLLKTYKGIKIYNDNNATTPEATIAGLEAIGSKKKNIILIAGGADKKLETKNLSKNIDQYCKALILLSGTGTDSFLKNKTKINKVIVHNLRDAVKEAINISQKGDIILLSPAFASFGMFINEYDRNDQFMKIIEKLK